MTAVSHSSPSRSNLILFLSTRIAARLACAPEEIKPDQDLLQLGLQSIDAVIISGELEDYIDGEVDPTLLLNHRTIAQIVDAFLDQRADSEESASTP
jgi:acyl carrier protein